MRFAQRLVVTFLLLSLTSAVPAHEEHRQPAENREQIGTVDFLVSCTTAAQAQFQRAVALQRSFWFEEAHFLGLGEACTQCPLKRKPM